MDFAKIRSFLLQALFLIVPLIYAWFYIPQVSGTLVDLVHTVFHEARLAGFESVKVSLFLFIIRLAAILALIEFVLHENRRLSRYLLVSLLVFCIWSVMSFFLNAGWNTYFLGGSPEKAHGWFFDVALLACFWLVYFSSAYQKKKYFQMTCLAFWGVIIYALFQKFWLDPIAPFYNSRLDPGRVFSTLGNPNYLAGYVLMILPLLRVYTFLHERSWEEHVWEILVWCVSALLIFWTGSYLAWIVFAAYACYSILTYSISDKKIRKTVLMFVGILIIVGWIFVWHRYSTVLLHDQKMKGFIARWYLWKTGISALTSDPFHFLFGFWSDGFLLVSEKFRDWHLSHGYEDPAYRIDSSHNFFIDFALQFWVPMLILFLYSIYRLAKNISHEKQMALMLFAVYFSFNIPVLVHFLLLIQILASSHDKHSIHIKPVHAIPQ